jgi:hypothetical protein
VRHREREEAAASTPTPTPTATAPVAGWTAGGAARLRQLTKCAAAVLEFSGETQCAHLLPAGKEYLLIYMET